VHTCGFIWVPSSSSGIHDNLVDHPTCSQKIQTTNPLWKNSQTHWPGSYSDHEPGRCVCCYALPHSSRCQSIRGSCFSTVRWSQQKVGRHPYS
jgi:hypothetical protein